MKANDGTTLTRSDQQLNRWREHISEILNDPIIQDVSDIEASENLEVNRGLIVVDEIQGTMCKIKQGKAPELDSSQQKPKVKLPKKGDPSDYNNWRGE